MIRYEDIEKFPEIEGMDWMEAKRYHNDSELLYELICDYYEAIESDIRKIEESCTRLPEIEALERLKIRMHTLKGTSAWIGATKIALEAEKLEKLMKEKNITQIQKEIPNFLFQYKKLGISLRTYFC